MAMPCICCQIGVEFEQPIRLMQGEPLPDGDNMSYPIHESCYQACTEQDRDFFRKNLILDSDEAAENIARWRRSRNGNR